MQVGCTRRCLWVGGCGRLGRGGGRAKLRAERGGIDRSLTRCLLARLCRRPALPVTRAPCTLLTCLAGCGGATHWRLEDENYEGWRVKVRPRRWPRSAAPLCGPCDASRGKPGRRGVAPLQWCGCAAGYRRGQHGSRGHAGAPSIDAPCVARAVSPCRGRRWQRRAAKRAGSCCGPRCTTRVGCRVGGALGWAGGQREHRAKHWLARRGACVAALLPRPPPPPLERVTSCRPLLPPADIVLNVESEHAGGMRAILEHLLEFFREHPGGRAGCGDKLPSRWSGHAHNGGAHVWPPNPPATISRLPPPPSPPSSSPPAEFDVCTGKVEHYVYTPQAA